MADQASNTNKTGGSDATLESIERSLANIRKQVVASSNATTRQAGDISKINVILENISAEQVLHKQAIAGLQGAIQLMDDRLRAVESGTPAEPDDDADEPDDDTGAYGSIVDSKGNEIDGSTLRVGDGVAFIPGTRVNDSDHLILQQVIDGTATVIASSSAADLPSAFLNGVIEVAGTGALQAIVQDTTVQPWEIRGGVGYNVEFAAEADEPENGDPIPINGSRYGTNLIADLSPWNACFWLANLTHHAQVRGIGWEWASQLPNKPNAQTGLPDTGTYRVALGHDMGGNYVAPSRVTTKGNGTIKLEGDGKNLTLIDTKVDGTKVYSCDVPQKTNNGFQVVVTGNLTALGMYEKPEDMQPQFRAAALAISRKIGGPLRWMDVQRTNGSTEQHWSNRPTVASSCYNTTGVPIEVMVDYCAAVGRDPYFCVPHLATDDYVRKFARLVRDRVVPPNVTVYVEHTNEAWQDNHNKFKQALWFKQDGATRGLQGNEWERQWRSYGFHAKRVLSIWHEEFTAETTSVKLVRCIGGQADRPGVIQQIIAQTGRLGDFADALVITTYFGDYIGATPGSESWTDERLATECRNHAQGRINGDWKAHAQIAQANGVLLGTYEGQHHIECSREQDPAKRLAKLNRFASFIRSPKLAEVEEWVAQQWFETLGGAFLIEYTEWGRPTVDGDWGLVRHEKDAGNTRFVSAVQTAEHYVAS